MASVQTGSKKMKIVNGMLVEVDANSSGQPQQRFGAPPPSQPYNMFPSQNTTTNQTTARNPRPQDEEVQMPIALLCVFLLLAEALFLNWGVVAVTLLVMLLTLAFFIAN
ncbi:hypothetical protein EIN_096090 [Entamoeba invadens IP1]|uniref:Uncharacterized protein n=1 Tax=Entamoeba invadens IP1 TaxID=370355 RepID=A0A0A1U0E6_ENTIV|nr:hypothetical protein EIN_096090 [Entamoeba invadens IP1]ELP87352.1 hypothetical protein EIN_096090 [Entamoeba invadens IP1]|eukprot:XP_004254123.1 hypothetical protein EIN_096090 [Entamoeba invadens IP1]